MITSEQLSMHRSAGSYAVHWFLAIALFTLLSGCSTLTSSGAVNVDGQVQWSVLELENLSLTPLAGRSAAALVETRLRHRGVLAVTRLSPEAPLSLAALLANKTASYDESLGGSSRYSISGVVHEWRYKAAPDKEAVVGLNLKLTDLADNRVLWQGSASRTGWGRTSLSQVADSVIEELLDELQIALPR